MQENKKKTKISMKGKQRETFENKLIPICDKNFQQGKNKREYPQLGLPIVNNISIGER